MSRDCDAVVQGSVSRLADSYHRISRDAVQLVLAGRIARRREPTARPARYLQSRVGDGAAGVGDRTAEAERAVRDHHHRPVSPEPVDRGAEYRLAPVSSRHQAGRGNGQHGRVGHVPLSLSRDVARRAVCFDDDQAELGGSVGRHRYRTSQLEPELTDPGVGWKRCGWARRLVARRRGESSETEGTAGGQQAAGDRHIPLLTGKRRGPADRTVRRRYPATGSAARLRNRAPNICCRSAGRWPARSNRSLRSIVRALPPRVTWMARPNGRPAIVS